MDDATRSSGGGTEDLGAVREDEGFQKALAREAQEVYRRKVRDEVLRQAQLQAEGDPAINQPVVGGGYQPITAGGRTGLTSVVTSGMLNTRASSMTRWGRPSPDWPISRPGSSSSGGGPATGGRARPPASP